MQLIDPSKKQCKEALNRKNEQPVVDLKSLLTIAATALLSTAPSSIAHAETVDQTLSQSNRYVEDNWSFDTAFLGYSEGDRVSAAEGVFSATRLFENDEVLNIKLTVDALTGASANGAVAQPNVQTFTRPSGSGQYTVAPGDTPLDDTFHDTRVQLNAQWTQPLFDHTRVSGGVHLSKEYDYLSLGLNSNVAIDFNQKNSTISFGGSLFQDTITPEGGIPIAFSSMAIRTDQNDSEWQNEFNDTRSGSEETKLTADVLLGFTQVINRRMLMQFNYSYSVVDGYMTDPFKIISVVNSEGLTQDNIYENRPDKRTKQSMYVQSMYHFDITVLDLSYRYMSDDWDVVSHTIDTRFRIPFGNDSYIQPHIRYYQQNAANFFSPFLNQEEYKISPPNFTSADYRIGEMSTYTLGVKYGTVINHGNDISFRLEYYHQSPTDSGFESPGALAQLSLYEPIEALIFQMNYSF